MSSQLQGQKMSPHASSGKYLRSWALILYALIFVAALTFDMVTDRSFGALMFAVLPISLIAAVCLLAGPWFALENRSIALKNWAIGATLVLLISIAFASMGAEQAKTGELIFTYAVLIIAVPFSIVLPFVTMWLSPLLDDRVILRIVFAWVICVAAGWLEWQTLSWLRVKIRR